MRGCMDVAVRTLLLGCLVGPGCAARRSPTIVGAVPGGIDAFVLRGEGMLTLDGTPTPFQSGDSAVIPRDRSHWFARRGDETAVALVVFSPALDAPDTVPDSVDAIPGRQ